MTTHSMAGYAQIASIGPTDLACLLEAPGARSTKGISVADLDEIARFIDLSAPRLNPVSPQIRPEGHLEKFKVPVRGTDAPQFSVA